MLISTEGLNFLNENNATILESITCPNLQWTNYRTKWCYAKGAKPLTVEIAGNTTDSAQPLPAREHPILRLPKFERQKNPIALPTSSLVEQRG